jgi:prepilin-type processing-associated H-X9-DG protein
MLWSNTAGRFVLFGLIYEADLMTDPRVFYCPAESNPRFSHATPDNPWPPGRDGDPTRAVQTGYALRPQVELPDDLANPPASLQPFTMPRLADFKSRAILADASSSLVRIDTRHVRGLNALFGDGSASFVERGPVAAALAGVPEPSFPPDAQWNDEIDRVWEALDRR